MVYLVTFIHLQLVQKIVRNLTKINGGIHSTTTNDKRQVHSPVAKPNWFVEILILCKLSIHNEQLT